MHTLQTLRSDICSLGIKSHDLLTVHTSLRAIGAIEAGKTSGAEVLIAALRESVSEGILMIPAHTFRNIREDGPVFDIRKTMPCIGTLPCVAVDMANRAVDAGNPTCIRSMQPSHSVVAFGRTARAFAEYDRASHTRTPMSGCYGRLYEEGGKILLIGVDLSRNTFIHAVDEEIDPTVHGSTVLTLTDYDGSKRELVWHLTQGPAAASFVRYTAEIERRGGLVRGKVGDADALLVDARICYDVVKAMPRI